MDKARFETFSDGVFAVAITLLALNLVVAGPGHGSLAHQLSDRWPSFAAYAVSFFTIGIIAVNHHALFKMFAAIDRVLVFFSSLSADSSRSTTCSSKPQVRSPSSCDDRGHPAPSDRVQPHPQPPRVATSRTRARRRVGHASARSRRAKLMMPTVASRNPSPMSHTTAVQFMLAAGVGAICDSTAVSSSQ